MSDIPHTIKISSLEFSVELVKDLKDSEGGKLYGECDADEQWIRLNSANRGHESKRLVLLHELVHIMENHAGLSLKESQIDSIARSIYSMVVDNPELIAWLTDPKPPRRAAISTQEEK